MATFPTDKSTKALEQKTTTSAARTPWQEPLDRFTTIPASKSIQAAEVLAGMAGSWASAYEMGSSVLNWEVGQTPPVVQQRVNRLGQPGAPEINFRPYDWGTNRFSTKGPSLLGHPISFSVVGPTMKSQTLEFQWYVTAGASQDTLTLDDFTIYSTAGVPVAFNRTLANVFNVATLPATGLYLVVSATGSKGYLNDALGGVAGTGGLGDGLYGTGNDGLTRGAITPLTTTSKYEVFRITGWNSAAKTITLDSGKRLSSYFTIPAVNRPIIRAVMVVAPAAARVVAVPGSGDRGKETVFAIVPPATALNSDLYPSYYQWAADVTWDPWTNYQGSAGDLGYGLSYGDPRKLPIPLPIKNGSGRVARINGQPITITPTGWWTVYVDPGILSAATDVGKVLRIYGVEQVGSAQLQGAYTGHPEYAGNPSTEVLLGWFQIAGISGADIDGRILVDLFRVPEVDPETGVPFFGFSGMLQHGDIDGNAPAVGDYLRLHWTLHDTVDSLWTSSYADINKISSARLTNIIDPSWSGSSLKTQGVRGGCPARPDKAIFDTTSSNLGVAGTNTNPGSLLDLGFRPVLFPAKVSGATLVPNFDHPITSREVILNPNLQTDQWVDIDYSAGLITLSDPPVPGPIVNNKQCEICLDPAVLTNASNPRGEMVFFISCVPYSREEGQLGANPRVTSGTESVIDTCADWQYQSDAFSQPMMFGLANQTITGGATGSHLHLSSSVPGSLLSPTGFVTLLWGDEAQGEPLFYDGQKHWASTFGYSKVYLADPGNAGNTTLLGVFGGARDGLAKVIDATHPGVALLHRQVTMPNRGDGSVGTDFRNDGSYGSSYRAKTVRFEAGEIEPKIDGSLQVRVRDPRATAVETLLGEVLTSEIISGGLVTAGAGLGILISGAVVLNQGKRQSVPAAAYTIPGGDTNSYIYLDCSDSTSCPVVTHSTTLPLPSSGDILLARVTHSGVAILTVTNLQHYLLDVDQRVDLTVGSYAGPVPPGTSYPHFETLSAAMQWIGETMDPVGVGGTAGSKYGKQWRIKVVGPVVETSAPVFIPTNGIIVEGSAKITAGTTPGDYSMITWAGDVSLFDLNGKDDLTFRDLAFRYTEGTAPGAIPNRAVFTANSAAAAGPFTSTNVLIENCMFTGANAHAFVLFRETSARLTGMFHSTIRNNYCVGPESFVKIITSDGGAADPTGNLTITDNYGTGTLAPASTEAAAVHLQGNDNHVSRNHFGSYARGIHLMGEAAGTADSRVVISDNYLLSTNLTGIWVERINPGSVISGNILLNLHGTANNEHGLGAGVKVGVFLDAVQSVHVTDNHIALNADDAADWGIYSNESNAQITGNNTEGKIFATTGSIVSGNIVLQGMEAPTTGITGLTVTGNVFGGTVTFVDVAQLLFCNNMVAGSLSLSNPITDSTVSNNFVALGSTLSVAGTRIVDNNFAGDLTVYSVAGAPLGVFGGRISGNKALTMLIGGTFLPPGPSFLDVSANITPTMTCIGYGLHITNNAVNTMNLVESTAAGYLQSSTLQGNDIMFDLVLARALVGVQSAATSLQITSNIIRRDVIGTAKDTAVSGVGCSQIRFSNNRIVGSMLLADSTHKAGASNIVISGCSIGESIVAAADDEDAYCRKLIVNGCHVGIAIVCSDNDGSCPDAVITGNSVEEPGELPPASTFFPGGIFIPVSTKLVPTTSHCVVVGNRAPGVWDSWGAGTITAAIRASAVARPVIADFKGTIVGNVFFDATPLWGNALTEQASQLSPIPYHYDNRSLGGGDAAHDLTWGGDYGLHPSIDHNSQGLDT